MTVLLSRLKVILIAGTQDVNRLSPVFFEIMAENQSSMPPTLESVVQKVMDMQRTAAHRGVGRLLASLRKNFELRLYTDEEVCEALALALDRGTANEG